ncbi:hypothetical protein QFZ91_007277 [Paraburkholderia sp. JPY419]
MVSMPLGITRAQSKSLNPCIGRVMRLMAPTVLFDHVVQILDLTNLDGRLALGIHRMKRCQIGAALVDSHRLGRAVLTRCLFKKPPGSSLVPLGSKQKVDGVARLVHGAIKIFSRALDLDITFIHAPTPAHRALVLAKCLLKQRSNTNRNRNRAAACGPVAGLMRSDVHCDFKTEAYVGVARSRPLHTCFLLRLEQRSEQRCAGGPAKFRARSRQEPASRKLDAHVYRPARWACVNKAPT